MASTQCLQFKKLGFHFMPTSDLLIARLRNKVQPSATDDSSTNHNIFPIIDTDLYSAEPWNLLKDEDPWEISNSGEKSSCTRTIYVFTKVKFVGANNKRAARTAGKGTWSGSTGEKNVDGERPGSVIGTRSYFEFKIHKDEVGKIIVPGHWSMHEYKLGGESYKGLDSIPLAKNLALCQITQVVEKSQGIHLSWPKTPFKLRFDKFKELGCFLKKRKQPEPADHEHQQQVGHQEVQKRNKKRKREGPTSSAPRTLIPDQDTPDSAMELEELLDRDDDDHRAQENRMDHEGGFNDQSSWAVDQNPNNFGDRDSEFAQQRQLELAKNSEKENYQNNLMSPADIKAHQPRFDPFEIAYSEEESYQNNLDQPVVLRGTDQIMSAANNPTCSYNYSADYHQVGGSLSTSLLSNNQMMASESENMGTENQLGTDIKAHQPQLDPFELANSEENNYQNNMDPPSCFYNNAAGHGNGGWRSENENLGMQAVTNQAILVAQPQLDPNHFSLDGEEQWWEDWDSDDMPVDIDYIDLDKVWEEVQAPYWCLGSDHNNQLVELTGINQMMTSMETPPSFYSAPNGCCNEVAGKENAVEVDGQQQNGPNSREGDQSLGSDHNMSSVETPPCFYSAADGYYNEVAGKENVVAVAGSGGQLSEQQKGQNSSEVDQSLGLDEEQQQYDRGIAKLLRWYKLNK